MIPSRSGLAAICTATMESLKKHLLALWWDRLHMPLTAVRVLSAFPAIAFVGAILMPSKGIVAVTTSTIVHPRSWNPLLAGGAPVQTDSCHLDSLAPGRTAAALPTSLTGSVAAIAPRLVKTEVVYRKPALALPAALESTVKLCYVLSERNADSVSCHPQGTNPTSHNALSIAWLRRQSQDGQRSLVE